MILALVDRIAALCGHGTTTRSATAEFGPTPGARYARELSTYSDAELIRRDRDELLDEIRASRRMKAGTR